MVVKRTHFSVRLLRFAKKPNQFRSNLQTPFSLVFLSSPRNDGDAMPGGAEEEKETERRYIGGRYFYELRVAFRFRRFVSIWNRVIKNGHATAENNSLPARWRSEEGQGQAALVKSKRNKLVHVTPNCLSVGEEEDDDGLKKESLCEAVECLQSGILVKTMLIVVAVEEEAQLSVVTLR
ncbi:AAEL008830-PA [Aedes aegypti]|uniref:AAEL008830-PA n=1 Tax=Aedes aegypti TaxID=7159 RepID=Q16XM7_AEDAE|nr:AAEL008830-PA [Aedes aegypti]